MFPVSYFVYSVNYLVCLLITIRTNQVGAYNACYMLVWNFMVAITTVVLGIRPQIYSQVAIDRKSQPTIYYI